MGNGGAWVSYALFAAPAALPVVAAVLSGWRPWEIVALVAVLAPSGAAAAWAWAWHAVHARRAALAELAGLSSDERAAQSLGRSLGKIGSYLPDDRARELWDVFAAAPTETKRALALAVASVVAETDEESLGTVVGPVRAIAAGFRGPVAAPAPQTEEQVARAFGAALGRCSEALDPESARELGELFAALPRDAKRAAASALAGYTEHAFLHDDSIGARLLALVRPLRDGSPADPELSPVLTP